jgi:Dyp-type peroxidase family
MENVEWKDVQGLVRSGFPDLPHAAYILWRFSRDCGPQAKEWLGNLANRLMRAEHDDAEEVDAGDGKPHQRLRPRSVASLKKLIVKRKMHDRDMQASEMAAVNVALTASGLKALGVEELELAYFSAEFREGMAPKPADGSTVSRRSSLLGDIGRDSPEHWDWGGWKNGAPIDGVMLLYATDEAALQGLIEEEERAMAAVAMPIKILRGRLYDDRKEHFGFTDGISQPAIEGTAPANRMGHKQARISVVKPGEFVLGYLNERGTRVSYPVSPVPGRRNSEAVPPALARDLMRDGTYLVFRQLEQHVDVFDKFISETAKLLHGELNSDTKDRVAARLVGRRPNGEPLISPAADSSPDAPHKRNDFLYYFEDRFGLACPIGAHIRRANPRDALGQAPDTALRLSKMHRIIRRGRIYGQRQIRDTEGQAQSAEPRGLHFICLNADIAGQFEMVQHTWLNSTHFNGLDHEADPMSHYRVGDSIMTFQHRPTNLRVTVPKLVTVRGGAYFFLPGIEALRSLARPEGAPLSVEAISQQ